MNNQEQKTISLIIEDIDKLIEDLCLFLFSKSMSYEKIQSLFKRLNIFIGFKLKSPQFYMFVPVLVYGMQHIPDYGKITCKNIYMLKLIKKALLQHQYRYTESTGKISLFYSIQILPKYKNKFPDE